MHYDTCRGGTDMTVTIFSAVFFTDYACLHGFFQVLVINKKKNRSFGNEKDNSAHFDCRSTGRFS